MVAAASLVETLASDTVFVARVAEDEIQRRITAGNLIPIERLQVAPGLTLVQAGRVEALEALLGDIVEKLGDDLPTDLADQAAGLLYVPPPTPAETPALPGAPGGDQTEDLLVRDPEPETDSPTPPDPGDPSDPPPGGRRRSRLPTEPEPCSECGTTALTEENTPEANLAQTRHSHIKERRALCRACLASLA
jgi:hypothetical protein